MLYSQIKSLSSEELQDKLVFEKANLQRLRFAHAISPIENHTLIRQNRRLIAKIKTAQSALKKQKS